MPQIEKLGGGGGNMGEVTLQAVGTSRRNFAIIHLQAAQHFADQLRLHEERHVGAGWGPHFDFCNWNGTAALVLSFSAIEAAIDEAEDDLKLSKELTDALDRAPTLEHAQALLAHLAAPTFDKGSEPYQSVDLLRAIRNGLVHPKAEWDNAREVSQQLSRRVRGAHLPISPFQQEPDLAFPYGCMSAGTAHWAANAARSFIRELRSRLGLQQ